MYNSLQLAEDATQPGKSETFFSAESLLNVQNSYQKNKQKQNNTLLIKKELTNTEWTNLLDSPLSPEKQKEWAVYRNQLKALLEINNDTIIWPIKPT